MIHVLCTYHICYSSLSDSNLSYVLIRICYNNSKLIDSMKVMKESRYFVMSSCLLAGHFPFLSTFCFKTSLCVFIAAQCFSRWSVVWSPCPQMHVASSSILKRWRYALVCMHVCVCVCVCMYVHIYIYIHIYIFIYTHAYICSYILHVFYTNLVPGFRCVW